MSEKRITNTFHLGQLSLHRETTKEDTWNPCSVMVKLDVATISIVEVTSERIPEGFRLPEVGMSPTAFNELAASEQWVNLLEWSFRFEEPVGEPHTIYVAFIEKDPPKPKTE